MKILKGIKLFNLHFSTEFLNELAPLIKEKRIMPDEYILK